MKISALLMDDTDNVVTCVVQIEAGEEIVYQKGSEMHTIIAEETIPFCHKIALKDFEKEDVVLKYGEMIGRTNEPVKRGHWISEHNIYSVPRDYESELV